MLAINPVGTPLTGPLTGKIVYTSGGHGWQYNSTLGRFATDRGDNNEIVEDFGNQDQLTFYADYLLRAGATVVPMRPVGHQLNEVVLDNDMPQVTYTGTWQDNTAGPRWYDEDYGAVTDGVKYRFATAVAGAETATATFTPNIPQAGFYPVYTWVAHSANRANQLYEINHTGGQSQVRVDHTQVGNGWVYLGTYHFNAGSSITAGSVQIGNSATGSNVIVDAIRFGNGMGDVPSGPSGIGTGSVSTYPREDENSIHWIWRSFGLGTTQTVGGTIGTSNVSAPSNMAQHMNLAAFGNSVYIGFHSNAGGGRGARGLIDSDQFTPHQADLALFTGRQINQDMQARHGQFEYNWSAGTTHTFSGAFGEIDLGASAEMDATIIEVAFHDSVEDAALMRDPRARDQLARSTYEATLEYFDAWGGLTSPVNVPSAPINARAVSNASGAVTLNWNAGPTGVAGAAATGYRIYVSTNGYGFDGGTNIAGGATTAATITGLDPNVPHYFKVVATNAGGESHETEVLAALPSGGAKRVLIVNGFDRFDRTGDIRYPYAHTGDGLVDRVFARLNNSFDYAVQVASAIHAAEPGTHVATTSNEAVISGAVNLSEYHTVVWISGEESTADDTFNATEQTKVEQFVANAGNLFVTGAEIGWDLDQQNNGRTFFETTLKGNYVLDDAGTYNVDGIAGGIFAGLSFSFDNGAQFYNVDFPDILAPQPGAAAAMNYGAVGGTSPGAAAIVTPGVGRRGNVILFGFPFEAITTAANRTAVMDRVLTYFGSAAPSTPDLVAASDSGADNTDNYTNYNNAPGKSLAINVPGTIAGALIDLYDGNTFIGSANATSSTTSVPVTGTLASGVRALTARQTEPGKGSSPSISLSLTIDTTAPAAPVPDLLAASDSGASNTDNITNDTTPTFAVSTEPASTPTLFVNGMESFLPVFTNPGGGTNYEVSRSVPPPLGNGVHTFAIQWTDRAGNVSAVSSPLTVRIDTVPPTASLGSELPTPGASTFDFTVVYNDASSLLDSATFGNDDVTVIHPGNTQQAATLIAVGAATPEGSRSVTYRIAAPGGTWDDPDGGTYTVVQNADGVVADVAGNVRAGGTIGTFDFVPPFAYLVGSTLHVDYLTTGNLVVALLAAGDNLDVTRGGTTFTFDFDEFDAVVLHGTSADDTLEFAGPIAEPITFDGGAGEDQIEVVSGTFTFASDAGALCDALGVHVADGATAVFNATQHLRHLDVDGSATLTQGGAKLLITRGLEVTGRLNLSDNDLVLDYAEGEANPLRAVEAMIAAAYDFGAWDLPGLYTDMFDATQRGLTTLAIADPFALFGLGASDTMEFSGITVDGTSVLVKYSYAGDVNLDGLVDGGDYGTLDNWIQFPGTSGYWNGDVNFDGVIDGADYGTLDNSIQLQGEAF